MTRTTTNRDDTLIVILGGSGRIGREVARLGVAYGAEVISVSRSGVPPTSEPWTEGVEWYRGDADDESTWRHRIEGADAVVAALPAERSPSEVARTVAEEEGVRLIELGCASRLPAATTWADRIVHLLIPDVLPDQEDLEFEPTDASVMVSHAAMAALRAAIEEDHQGLVEPAEVARLGDSVFLQ